MSNRYKLFAGLVLSIVLGGFSAQADEEDLAVRGGKQAEPDRQSNTPANDSEPNPRRLALVIGNAAYQHIPSLDNPVNDSREVCKVLRSLGFDASCFEDLPNRRSLKTAISDFAEKLTKGDAAVVYYAGHGLQVRGENYIVPIQSVLHSAADIEDETVPLNYLMARLDEAKNGLNLIILDACRNNPLGKSRAVVEGGGLAPVDAPAGSIVIYATAPGKVALDGDKASGHGIFTAHLLKNIVRSGLTAEEMFKLVTKGVQDETSKKYNFQQTPWINSSYSGRFCFAGCDDPQLTQEVARIKKERELLERRAKELEADKIDREKRISALEAEIKKSQAEFSNRTKEIDEAAEATRVQKNKPNPELVKLQKQLDQYRASNKELVDESAHRQQEKEELDALRRKMADLEKRSAEAEAANNALKELAHRPQASAQPTAPPETVVEPRKRSIKDGVRHLPPAF